MTQVIIASQLDEDYNQVIRALACATVHPEAQVIGVPVGVPSDLPPRRISCCCVRSTCAATPPRRPRRRAGPTARSGRTWCRRASTSTRKWLFNGPPVTTSRGSAADNLAEFALAAIFAASKHLPDIWVKDRTSGSSPRCARSRAPHWGFSGFGAIGERLAQKAHALGIKVVALRQSPTPFGIDGVEAAKDIHDLFARADHLVLAAPLTEATRAYRRSGRVGQRQAGAASDQHCARRVGGSGGAAGSAG